ncbi:MAG: uracil-DNA glycosylase family protein, partial [Anaerolineales bacterium]
MSPTRETFAQLQLEMRACRKCLEADYWVQPPAVTQGTHTARMMTIGQAPGITEVEAGRPFNAGSGKRLFEWLCKAGID